MLRRSALLALVVALVVAPVLKGCIVQRNEIVVSPITRPPSTGVVSSPVKVHLVDGFSVTFQRGVVFGGGYIRGHGEVWDLSLQRSGTVEQVRMDSIAGMEAYRAAINGLATVALSIPAVALGGIMLAGLSIAVFGSCPTFYVDEGGTAVLEAEGFSYSIAPLLEARDVDRLSLRVDAAGALRLEVRNEALETHYMNHVELLEVIHGPDERILPDQHGQPVAVAGSLAAGTATDRSGRSVASVLVEADGEAFGSAEQRLAEASLQDLHDHIDLTFPAPAGADSVAIILRVRNSLLTTILLYDVLMADAGPRALDWLGRDLERVGTALELGQWYTRQMGLHVQAWSQGEFRPVARLSETGPIAWKDVAVVVPVESEGDSLRLRLRFVTDNWRIDGVTLAARMRRPEAKALMPDGVTTADGEDQPTALAAIRYPDEEYLTTTPGQRYFMTFGSELPAEQPRTYLLAAQGYYTEWMRADWLRNPFGNEELRPSDALLLEALRRWRDRREDFEEQFYASKIPVR
jgi:hypothetical protein